MNSRLRLTIFVSLTIHAAGAFWFFYVRPVVNSNAKKGVVSVSFIQSVSHGTTVSPKLPKKKDLPNPDPKPSTEVSPNTIETQTPLQGEVGDPQTIAKESDLFITAVTRLIEQRKIFPKEAVDREQEGKVIVGISLDRDGHVLEVKIEEPSPFELLNSAALKTVNGVQFPKVPEIVPVPIHLHVPLIYRIERN